MAELRELLVEDLRRLLDAERQLVEALPKMVEAAHHPKLSEAFQKHLTQTEEHADRLREALEMLSADAEPAPARAMQALIEEGQETIEEASGKEETSADLMLIEAAQKVEHYEISAYGTARTLALQIGERGIANLLSRTLGDEETADYVLTAIAKPILQEAALASMQGAASGDGQQDAKRPAKAPRVRHA